MPAILTIDDDYLYREILLDVFDMYGFQVIEAHNGRLGLQLAKERRPDLITCDIRMPDLNGYEVLKALRHDPVTANIPFIFLTSEQTNSARYYAMKFGANGFLPKFCTFEQLMSTIKLLLVPAEQASVLSEKRSDHQCATVRASHSRGKRPKSVTPLNSGDKQLAPHPTTVVAGTVISSKCV